MFEVPLQSQVVLSEAQLAAVGCVAVESRYLELHVEAAIWMLSGLDAKRGPHFTTNVQLGNRLELLASLGSLALTDKQRPEFGTLISDLKACAADRNTVIHGTWLSQAADYLALFADGPGAHPSAVAVKERRNKEPVSMPATNIMNVAKEIAVQRQRLGEFVSRAWPNAWRERPPLREPS
jgi:hypothetical protein